MYYWKPKFVENLKLDEGFFSDRLCVETIENEII